MTHLIWYDAFRTKKSYKRKVCFIMYIRKSLLGGLVAAAGMAVLPLLLFGNADPVRSLCRSMVWLPLRDAARGLQNLPP